MYHFYLKALPLLDCSDHWHIDIDHLSVSKKATGSKLLNLYQAPAQQLKRFEEPADIVAHPCGEYILNELQSGVPAEQVRKVLFEEYLIETTFCRRIGVSWSKATSTGRWRCWSSASGISCMNRHKSTRIPGGLRGYRIFAAVYALRWKYPRS